MATAGHIVEVDGSFLEGGGQIVRTAVALAAATGRPCRIFDIRKGRPNPGLAAQHLCGVRAVARLCGARLEGDRLGSTELSFEPGPLNPPERLEVEVGTAGSVCLVLQALMPALVASGRTVDVVVRGGTHVAWAPTTDYFRFVFAPVLGKMGPRVEVLEVREGFYPRGGGMVHVRLRPGGLEGLQLLERGRLVRKRLLSLATEDLARARVAERQAEGAAREVEFDAVETRYCEARSTGTAVLAVAELENTVLGASALGRRGRPAEQVGREAARRLAELLELDACLDEHMADQILPFLALSGRRCEVSVAAVTDHCRTNVAVIERFLPVRFEVDEARGLVSCGGPGQSS